MSEHPVQPGGNDGYEREDLGSSSIFGFLLGLAVFGILVYFAANGVYWALEKYSESHQPQQNALKTRVEADTRDLDPQKVRGEVQATFPEPRLETDERNEMIEPRTAEEEHLNSYGYVNPQGGAVHIPIQRAMQLIAERGLPVRAQGEAAPKEMGSKKDSAAKP